MIAARRPPVPAWLTCGRVILYGSVILTFYFAILLAITVLAAEQKRIDFLAFHSAGRMALAGEAPRAYDWEALRPVQAAGIGVPEEEVTSYLGWLNPPHFFFAILPFALLSYGWAWFGWVVSTGLLLAFAIRAVLPGRALPAAVLGLIAPGILMCLSVGQNGMLTAALLGFTYALLDRRPVAAGIALGLLTIKPQLGLIAPLLLAATGRWRAFGAAAGTAAVASAAALVAFGPEAWMGFFATLGQNNERYLGDASGGIERMQSVYILVLWMTADARLAWIVHGVFALAVAVLVLRLWTRRPEGPDESRAAAAIAAAFLMTPYVWLYDTPALAVAALFLARAAMRDGWLPWELPLLVLACLWIQLMTLTGPLPIYALGSWILLLGCAWRRDRVWRCGSGHVGLQPVNARPDPAFPG